MGRARLRPARRGEPRALPGGYHGHGALGPRHGRQPILHHPLAAAAPRRDLHRVRTHDRGSAHAASGRDRRPHPQHPPVMRPLHVLAAAVVLLVGIAPPAAAQFGYFGQNKIQYRRFDWRMLRGEHVDLYYYPEEEELGRVALAYAEASYDSLERRFAHAVRRRVTLPFTGSYADFRHTLRHELVHVFQLSLYGEAAARHTRVRLPGMPLWFSEGLAEYFSAGEDSRDEMILRDLTISGDLPTLGQLAWASGGIVYPLGGAIVRFLGTTYGDWRIGELYRALWKYTTFEEAVAGVYGKTLTQLSGEWLYWMRRRYYPAVQEGRPLAVSAEVLARLAIKPTAYRLPGDSVAAVLYFSPSTGYTNIYARPL